MNRFIDNCFSRFPRTSRDDPSRGPYAHYGPWHRPGRLRRAASEAGMVLMAVAFFAGLVFSPAIWTALVGR